MMSEPRAMTEEEIAVFNALKCPECSDENKVCTKEVCPLIPDEWDPK